MTKSDPASPVRKNLSVLEMRLSWSDRSGRIDQAVFPGGTVFSTGIDGGSFRGARMPGAVFCYDPTLACDDQVVAGTDFAGAVLAGAKFDGVVVAGCNFRGADLTGVDFRTAHVVGCDFHGADLTGATGLVGTAEQTSNKFDGAKLDKKMLFSEAEPSRPERETALISPFAK